MWVKLDDSTAAAMVAVLDRHDALDLVDALGLREMAEHARGLKAASFFDFEEVES